MPGETSWDWQTKLEYLHLGHFRASEIPSPFPTLLLSPSSLQMQLTGKICASQLNCCSQKTAGFLLTDVFYSPSYEPRVSQWLFGLYVHQVLAQIRYTDTDVSRQRW